MKVDWAVQSFWNESRQGIVAQQERALEARRETTLVFFPYQSSHCKKKICGATAVVLKTAPRSCLLQCVRLKDEILILAPLFQQLCRVQHHSEQSERCHPASAAAFVPFKRFHFKPGTHKIGKWKWKSHCWESLLASFAKICLTSTWVEYLCRT